MEGQVFRAMIVEEAADGRFVRRIGQKSIDDLPAGDVLVAVKYSSLNYKDALSATGHRGVTKQYPHTPGIDAAGVVEASSSPEFQPGEQVIVTSYDLGMNTSGGFGQYIRVPAEWVVKLPANLSLKESMQYGTAGFTAALSVFKLVDYGITPGDGPILVTGATGGVGSIALSILAKAGYEVTAVSGKAERKPFLIELGAKEVISRTEAADTSGRPLLRERWAGVVDTVGGEILESALKSIRIGGAATCCGNVASERLHTTVYPFILRGVSLFGIDSQHCPMPIRRTIWEKLSAEWKLEQLDRLTSECSLDELAGHIELMLQGKQSGRVMVDLNR